VLERCNKRTHAQLVRAAEGCPLAPMAAAASAVAAATKPAAELTPTQLHLLVLLAQCWLQMLCVLVSCAAPLQGLPHRPHPGGERPSAAAPAAAAAARAARGHRLCELGRGLRHLARHARQ